MDLIISQLETLIFLRNCVKIIAFKILRIQVGPKFRHWMEQICFTGTCRILGKKYATCRDSYINQFCCTYATPPEMIMSHNVFIAVITAKSRTWFCKYVSCKTCCNENIFNWVFTQNHNTSYKKYCLVQQCLEYTLSALSTYTCMYIWNKLLLLTAHFKQSVSRIKVQKSSELFKFVSQIYNNFKIFFGFARQN